MRLLCLTVVSFATAVSACRCDAAERVTEKEITNSIGLKLVRIPAGEFMMGSPESEKVRPKDEAQHRVRITRTFYLGAYAVTRGQFRQFVEATDYRT